MIHVIWFFLLLFYPFAICAKDVPAHAQIAIIIDDIGYQKVDPLLINLPYPLTFAVMPFAPNSQEMAALAATLQKEIILHMPMEAVSQNHLLGRGALLKSMDQAEMAQSLARALAAVPQAVGINNHMGSMLTSLEQPMQWIMQVVAQRQLYFIDSKTTSRSVIEKVSQQNQVRSRSRDIFLDNQKSYAAIDLQFQQLLTIALQQGSAIAIGHPYPETYHYLKKNLPLLAQKGIQVVPVSQLLQSSDTSERQLAKKISAKTKEPDGDQASTITATEPKQLPDELPVVWQLPYRSDLPGLDVPSTQTKHQRFWPLPPRFFKM